MLVAHATYQLRGYCNKAGYARLDRVLGWLCDLGNAALQERRDAWRMCRTSISYKLQCQSLTLVRRDDPANLGSVNTAVERGALQRINRAFAAFFRRCKAGGKPGYPRFRSRRRYTTIEVNDVRPNQVQSFGATTLVRINGLPTIRLVSDRQLPDAKPCAIRIVRRTAGCTVDLVYDEEKVALAPTGETVGVDVGTRKRFSLSTGEITPPIAEDWKAIRRAQRAVARCERASRGRRKCVEDLARLRRHEAVRRRNSCHVVTSDLVKRFDLITIEDLRIGNMTASAAGTVDNPGRNVKAKTGLNRSILQQAWGIFRQQLVYKAEWAGRQLKAVNAAYTSQDCSVCGHRRSKPDARERWRCEHCAVEHDRDVSAAVNIDRAGILALGSRSGERVAA